MFGRKKAKEDIDIEKMMSKLQAKEKFLMQEMEFMQDDSVFTKHQKWLNEIQFAKYTVNECKKGNMDAIVKFLEGTNHAL